jgi:parallel beta-helix repeat protein
MKKLLTICLTLFITAQIPAAGTIVYGLTITAPGIYDGNGQTVNGIIAQDLADGNVTVIQNYIISGSKEDGVRFDRSKNLIVQNCYIHDNKATGIAGDNTLNCQILNNRINGGTYGIFCEESKGLIIKGNEITRTDIDGICLQNSTTANPCDAQILYNNIHDAVFGGDHEDAMQLWGSYDGLKVSNNCVGDFTQLCYICTPAEDGIVKNVLIQDNVFYNKNYKATQNSDTQGVFIGRHSGGVSNITIKNNVFGDVGYDPIWLYTGRTIKGVTITGNQWFAGDLIDTDTTLTDLVVTGNTMNAPKFPVWLPDANIPPPIPHHHPYRHHRIRPEPNNTLAQ